MSSHFLVENITALTLPLSEHPYVLILHADKQPVHVAFIFQRHYFSLTYKGAEVLVDMEQRLKMIRIRKIPCLFLQLKPTSNPIQQKEITDIFLAYPPLQSNDTCLSPVWDVLKLSYGLEQGQSLIFGLIEALEVANLIEQKSAYYLPISVEGSFVMPRYSSESVQQRILELKSNNS
ncbi:MAG TPA: hypothetical protein PK281_02500 [Flavobacteriales bacterium]|nr:hypothetical protein [Flavobacteriales bacterium]